MEELLSWQQLIFYIPLVLGIALVFGASLDIGGGLHHDSDHDSDHDQENDGLSLLGLGKVPLMIRLMLLSLTFGGIGIIMSLFLTPVMKASTLQVGIELPVAFFGSFFISAAVARLIGRKMPLVETQTVKAEDLCGSTGLVTLEASEAGGYAQVTDKFGNMQQVAIRTQSGVLAPGSKILLFVYDAEKHTYVVVPNDME